MDGKNSFRVPLLEDEDGLYITTAQMQFFLNRPKGKKKFEQGDDEFLNYYKNCCVYNLVYDMMEKSESCASMYWDSDLDSVAVSFPMKGKVAEAIADMGMGPLREEDEEDDDDDTFGIFK